MRSCAVVDATKREFHGLPFSTAPGQLESIYNSSSYVPRLPSAFHPTLLAAPARKAPCNSARMSACTSVAAGLHAQLCFHLHVAALRTPPLYPALLAADPPLPCSCAAFACSLGKPFKVGFSTSNIPPCQAASYARDSLVPASRGCLTGQATTWVALSAKGSNLEICKETRGKVTNNNVTTTM